MERGRKGGRSSRWGDSAQDSAGKGRHYRYSEGEKRSEAKRGMTAADSAQRRASVTREKYGDLRV